jgi:hypothetical protein
MYRGDFAYDVVLLLHILGAVVGLGAVFLNGIYGNHAKRRPGAPGLAIMQANADVTKLAEYVIYTIPVTGVLLVLMSDIWRFSQFWIWMSLLLYAAAIGIARGNQVPCGRRMLTLAAEVTALSERSAAVPAGAPPADTPGSPSVQVVEMQALGRRLAVGGAALNLLTVAILVLMTFKPGL